MINSLGPRYFKSLSNSAHFPLENCRSQVDLSHSRQLEQQLLPNEAEPLSASSLSNSFILASSLRNSSISASSLSNSFVFVSSKIEDNKSVPSSISEQLINIRKSIETIASNFGEDTVIGANIFCGGFTLYHAIVAACTVTTGVGLTAVIAQGFLGILSFGSNVNKAIAPPLAVQTMLSNADGLISMVKITEEVNLTELKHIRQHLDRLEIASNDINLRAETIKAKITESSEATKQIYLDAEKKIDEAKANIANAKSELELSQKDFDSANAGLIKATGHMISLKQVMEYKVYSIEEVKELLKTINHFTSLAIDQNKNAQEFLNSGQHRLQQGINQLDKSKSYLIAVDSDLKHATVLQEKIEIAVVEETEKIQSNVRLSKQVTKELRSSVNYIETNIKANLINLDKAQDEIAKAKAAWNRFLSYGAAYLGMMAAMGTITAFLAITGTGFVSLGLGAALGIMAGGFTATVVNESPTLMQFLSNKINNLWFGNVVILEAEDELPKKNESIIKFDNLSSSLWGKINKRASDTVGCLYLNVAGKQLNYRFDLREEYPISPKDLSDLINEIKSALEKDPNSVDLDQLSNDFIVSASNEHNYPRKHAGRKLLGLTADTILANLKDFKSGLLKLNADAAINN